VTEFPPCCIQASAGTGKTYRLSSRFIALLAAGEKPDRILATTFTRKAAYEIEERIFQRLASAALDQKSATALEEAIGCPCSCEKAGELLLSLIRQQHRLNISTLDSFFFKIAASFSLELGLMPGWQLSDPQSEPEVMREALRGVCESHEVRKIVSILQVMNAGSAQRGIHHRLEGELEALFEAFRSSEADAWKSLKPATGLDPEALEEIIAALQALEIPRLKSGAESKAWVAAIRKDVERVAGRDWDTFVARGIASQLLDGKTSYYTIPISKEFEDRYKELIRHASSFLLGRMREQTLATYELLQCFDAEYNRLRRLRQDLSFGDIKKRLSNAAITGRLAELYYRLDQQIAHLLFDEFQDTSGDEWRVLEPIVDEVRSKEDYSFFCVGDTKQAIYGWRGGDAGIFEDLGKHFAVESMQESRRCSLPVIEFVNSVFSRLAENPALEEEQDAVSVWQRRFQVHSALDDKKPGYVKCSFLEFPEETDKAVLLKESLVGLVQRVSKEAPAAEIGILVRRNIDVAALIFALHTAGIKASEEGGNKLTDSPLVCAFLSLLRFAEHPRDLVSRYHAFISPLGPCVGLDDFDDEKKAAAAAEQIRRKVFADGFGDTLARLTELLGPSCAGREARRVGQLRELAHEFDQKKTARITDFVELVERISVEDP